MQAQSKINTVAIKREFYLLETLRKNMPVGK